MNRIKKMVGRDWRRAGKCSRHIGVIVFFVALLTLISSVSHALNKGDTAPYFSQPKLSGSGEVSSYSLLGKVVYLDFWASWCGPCRVSLPAMNTLYRELAADGLVVVAINMDESKPEAEAFLQRYPLQYPVLQGQGKVAERYGVQGMPVAFLIDRSGVVRDIHYGFRPGDQQRMREKITALLAESTTEGSRL
ncbi:MAG: TlpA family protein disulfide reductase [Spongiibacteraceae bacterium]